MTAYQLLLRKNDDDGWREWKTEQAHSASAAIQAAYLKSPDTSIVAAVAIPLKSWKPTPIRAEQVTKVVLGAAEPEKQEELS